MKYSNTTPEFYNRITKVISKSAGFKKKHQKNPPFCLIHELQCIFYSIEYIHGRSSSSNIKLSQFFFLQFGKQVVTEEVLIKKKPQNLTCSYENI